MNFGIKVHIELVHLLDLLDPIDPFVDFLGRDICSKSKNKLSLAILILRVGDWLHS